MPGPLPLLLALWDGKLACEPFLAKGVRLDGIALNESSSGLCIRVENPAEPHSWLCLCRSLLPAELRSELAKLAASEVEEEMDVPRGRTGIAPTGVWLRHSLMEAEEEEGSPECSVKALGLLIDSRSRTFGGID